MLRYIYAFEIEHRADETFFVFPKFPEILSAPPRAVFDTWDEDAIQSHADDAVLTALQTIVLTRDEIPAPDDLRVDRIERHVALSVVQCMKLQLALVFAAQCTSVAEFARRIDKPDTAARRLLNLRHRSAPDEVTEALGKLGKQLEHAWGLEPLARAPAPVRETVPVD